MSVEAGLTLGAVGSLLVVVLGLWLLGRGSKVPCVLLALGLLASPASAQTWTNSPKPPPPPACCCPEPWALKPFDPAIPASLITLRTAVPAPGGAYLLLYSAPLAAAALIDPRTGLAQILPVDPATHHGIVFDGVEVLTPSFFIWRSGATSWGQPWHTDAPWVPMPGWSWR